MRHVFYTNVGIAPESMLPVRIVPTDFLFPVPTRVPSALLSSPL